MNFFSNTLCFLHSFHIYRSCRTCIGILERWHILLWRHWFLCSSRRRSLIIYIQNIKQTYSPLSYPPKLWSKMVLDENKLIFTIHDIRYTAELQATKTINLIIPYCFFRTKKTKQNSWALNLVLKWKWSIDQVSSIYDYYFGRCCVLELLIGRHTDGRKYGRTTGSR